MSNIEVIEAMRELRSLLPPDLVKVFDRIDVLERIRRNYALPLRERLAARSELRGLSRIVRHLFHHMTPAQRVAAERAGTLLSRYGVGTAAAERFALRAGQALRTGTTVRAARAVAAVVRVFAAALRVPVAAVSAVLIVLLAVGLLLPLLQDDASPQAAFAAGPDCDCGNSGGAMFEGYYRNDCLARQAQLVGMYRENALKLRADADGRLVYGEFCDSGVSGPMAWPAAGASIDPPARGLEVKPCTERSGLVQRCG